MVVAEERAKAARVVVAEERAKVARVVKEHVQRTMILASEHRRAHCAREKLRQEQDRDTN